jgi:hypothetical protein
MHPAPGRRLIPGLYGLERHRQIFDWEFVDRADLTSRLLLPSGEFDFNLRFSPAAKFLRQSLGLRCHDRFSPPVAIFPHGSQRHFLGRLALAKNARNP